ncbi:MAG: FAD-binding oxidoreductase, partial [Streptomycetales bacterium]
GRTPARTVSGTVGGVVAANASGPLRLGYGTPRDLLIGVTVVRADGKVARAGGKVVKNVAGYDLGKLFTGSYGTLGIITETVFRLHPLPTAAAYLTCPVSGPDEAHRQVQAVIHAQLAPVAVELDLPAPAGPGTVGLLLEGIGPGVEARTRQALAFLGEGAGESPEPPPWWGSYPFGTGDVALRLTAEIAALPHVLEVLGAAAAAHGVGCAVRGSAAVGVLHAGIPGDAEPAAVAGIVADLRTALARYDGTAVVLRAPEALRSGLDPYGPVPALDLMRRVKDQFDPDHRLAPGRYVGGI